MDGWMDGWSRDLETLNTFCAQIVMDTAPSCICCVCSSGEEMGGTSSGHIPAAKDIAHPPPRRPVPPHRVSPPQVGRGSPSLVSSSPFIPVVCSSCQTLDLTFSPRWLFVAQPARCALSLCPWWCSYCCRRGSIADHEEMILETDNDNKDWDSLSCAVRLSLWSLCKVSHSEWLAFRWPGWLDRISIHHIYRCTVCVLMLPVLTSTCAFFVFNSDRIGCTALLTFLKRDVNTNIYYIYLYKEFL